MVSRFAGLHRNSSKSSSSVENEEVLLHLELNEVFGQFAQNIQYYIRDVLLGGSR